MPSYCHSGGRPASGALRAHLEARGLPVRPRSTAVCVHRELIEDPPVARG